MCFDLCFCSVSRLSWRCKTRSTRIDRAARSHQHIIWKWNKCLLVHSVSLLKHHGHPRVIFQDGCTRRKLGLRGVHHPFLPPKNPESLTSCTISSEKQSNIPKRTRHPMRVPGPSERYPGRTTLHYLYLVSPSDTQTCSCFRERIHLNTYCFRQQDDFSRPSLLFLEALWHGKTVAFLKMAFCNIETETPSNEVLDHP